MSLLAPLYFIGVVAIGLPILFHLIRRRPRGEVSFSSLMFLRPTPPRLTRRSRLDNLLLLLLRALALFLLAFAFARPFFRSTAQSDADLETRRMMLLIDTSASMQRAGLWQQALDRANHWIDDLQQGDQLAIIGFDALPQTILSFEESTRLALPQRKATARTRIAALRPTWGRTDIGRALRHGAELSVSYEPEDRVDAVAAKVSGAEQLGTVRGPAHMILISDLQAGSEIESLQQYAWPDQLRLDLERVQPLKRTNASAQILTRGAADEAQSEPEEARRLRVRVSNSADATDSRFRLIWSGSRVGAQVELPVQVPPGETRVVRMPLPPAGATELVLGGDAHAFDNARYVVAPEPRALRLLYLGRPGEGPRDSLLYYLQRLPLDDALRTVTVEAGEPADLSRTLDPKQTPLVVTDRALGDEATRQMREYLAAGGRLLFVLAADDELEAAAMNLNALTESASKLAVSEADVTDYVMLSRIDFRDAVFSSMADPQFNDFTKIRIWSHRRIAGLDESWKVLSRFDDEDPALIARPIGEGQLWVLATGWQNEQSQLALSSKFVPLMFSFFEADHDHQGRESITVGEPLPFEPSPNAQLVNPAGATSKYQSSKDSDAVDQPGVYQYDDGKAMRSFAVNLHAAESRTEPMAATSLERFGVRLGEQETSEQAETRQRQLRDLELESRQRVWQWLLLAALALLALETWLGGWLSRGRGQAVESGLET